MTRLARDLSIITLTILAGLSLLYASHLGEQRRCQQLDPSSRPYSTYCDGRR